MNVRTATRIPVIILAAAAVNLLMFTAIEYMVGSERMAPPRIHTGGLGPSFARPSSAKPASLPIG